MSQSLRSCNELRRADRAFSIPVVALSGNFEKAATHPNWCPGVDKSINHRVRLFWVNAFLLLLIEPFRGSFQHREFLFELPNLMSCRSKFSRFLGTIPRRRPSSKSS